MIRLITAVGKNGEIGLNGYLPWGREYLEDKAWYRSHTRNNIRVGCRGSFRNISDGRPFYIVSSTVREYPNSLGVFDWTKQRPHEILETIQANHPEKDIYIIGGRLWYHASAYAAQEIYLTRINKSFPHDVRLDVDILLKGKSLERSINGSNPDLNFEIWSKAETSDAKQQDAD